MRTRYMGQRLLPRAAPDTRAQYSPYWGDAAPIAGLAASGPGASDYGCPPCIVVAAVVPAVVAAGTAIYATERQRAMTQKLAEDQKKENAKQEKRLADQEKKTADALAREEKRAQKAALTTAPVAAPVVSPEPAVSPLLLGAVGLGLLYLLAK